MGGGQEEGRDVAEANSVVDFVMLVVVVVVVSGRFYVRSGGVWFLPKTLICWFYGTEILFLQLSPSRSSRNIQTL